MGLKKSAVPYLVKLNGRVAAAFRTEADAWEFAQYKFNKISCVYSAAVVDVYTGKEIQGFIRAAAAA